MSLDILRATPSSAVATAGTITFAYPAGRSAGSYGAYGHKAFIKGLQVHASVDLGQFSLTFNTVASGITFTWLGSTSIPANTEVVLQVNMVGQDDQAPWAIPGMKRMAYAPMMRIDLGSPKATDDDAIAESQTVTGAGTAFVLDGVQSDLYGGANVKLDVPRALTGGWSNSAVITVTGKDEYGDVIVEQSASGTTFAGKKAFAEITSVTTSATITGAKIGIADILGLPVYVEKAHQIVGELRDGRMIGVKQGKIRLHWNAEQVSVLAGTVGAIELISPVAGVVTKLTVVTRVAVGTGGAVTAKVGTTDIDGLSVTVADSSTKGTTASDTPTAGHASAVVAKDSRIQIVFADAFATTGALDGYIEIEPTDVASGTFVAGVQTAPTATTGDVRGTYDPEDACDGILAFSLLALVPDPTYKGVDNYDG